PRNHVGSRRRRLAHRRAIHRRLPHRDRQWRPRCTRSGKTDVRALAPLDRSPLEPAQLIVAPLGLKTSGAGEPATGGMIGIFPVVSETPERLVAGFNDNHLDFRVVVDVATVGAGQQVTATTLVRTHNWLGRTYLAVILPFHRLIVSSMLRRGARPPPSHPAPPRPGVRRPRSPPPPSPRGGVPSEASPP